MFAETKVNKNSSRSHTVFRIQVEIEDINTQTGRRSIRTSQINLVDLAGSEGASKTRAEGMRLREGGNINKSLLALSNVIHKLSQR
jgi:centromeric protein E